MLELGLNADISQAIINKTLNLLINRLFTVGIGITFITVVIGYLLTYKTLIPINLNMKKQKRFIADASHDLRTPIAIAISSIEVALHNKDLDVDTAKKVLREALKEMKEMSQLSNNLLNLSKYDGQISLELRPININEVLRMIIDRTKELAHNHTVELKTEMMKLPIIINGDKIELSQVFYNIIDNALKYTPPGGTVSISDRIISENYVVTVSDSGIGIPSSILDRVFDPFFRSDSARVTEGVGLGLTLTKKIIESHKGSIVIRSEVNEGTNVIISFPISSYEFHSGTRIW
jgi:signal transduction histidine kinase